MKRIFDAYAYGDGPRTGCWWDETSDVPDGDLFEGSAEVDVAIVGGGFTGLSAALRLAEAGATVAVFEAERFGWGASGRNGGFCCLGGGIASDDELDKRYSRDARVAFRQAEVAAVRHVEETIMRLGLDVDRHSDGETELAHRPKDMTALRRSVVSVRENYGVEPQLIEKSDLAAHGMQGGPFFGGMTIPLGFGLNPRKYLAGLVAAAQAAGVLLFDRAPVTRIARDAAGHRLECADGSVRAAHVLVATNGYSSEDVPPSLAGRYMPGQSTVLVTRPMRDDELDAQGWTTAQMSYDTRNLLHYFRLMPDRRFLFGMRGGLLTGPSAEARARRRTRADFEAMFPQWAHVHSRHSWSGMVSLARNKLPFVGMLPGSGSVWASMCYHGNGVAMGSYAGRLVADMILGRDDTECPHVMQDPLARFPFGAARRLVMPSLYAHLMYQQTF